MQFQAGATVTFDGIAATGVTFVSSSHITATTPAHASGAVSVTVTNPDSQLSALVGGYAYVSPIVAVELVSGKIAVSNDNGESWVQVIGAIAHNYTGVIKFDAVWIAYGNGSSYSTDEGATWIQGPTTPTIANTSFASGPAIAASPTLLVASKGGTRSVYTSADGIAWALQANVLPGDFGASFGNAEAPITYSTLANLFLAITYDVTFNTPIAATSPDGINWTGRGGFAAGYGAGGTLSLPNSNTAGFLAGRNGGPVGYKTSADGIAWSASNVTPFSNSYAPQGCNNGSVWAVCDPGGSANVYTSPDGINWTTRTPPAGTYYTVSNVGTRLFASGLNTIAFSDDDGATWTSGTITGGQWRGVA